jgi:hypothetical protein
MQSSFLGSSNGLRAGRAFAPSRVSPVVPTVVAHYGGKANLGGGKPWERTQVNHNGKPVKVDMHIKKGDIVQVRMCGVPGGFAVVCGCLSVAQEQQLGSGAQLQGADVQHSIDTYTNCIERTAGRVRCTKRFAAAAGRRPAVGACRGRAWAARRAPPLFGSSSTGAMSSGTVIASRFLSAHRKQADSRVGPVLLSAAAVCLHLHR